MAMMEADGVAITGDAFRRLVQLCEEKLPHEACGILARSEHAAAIDIVIPIRNIHRSPADAFAFDPADWTEAFFAMQKNRQSIAGLFHSHPGTAALPSERDRAGFLPASGMTYWIVSLANGTPHIQPYRLEGGRFLAIPLMLA